MQSLAAVPIFHLSAVVMRRGAWQAKVPGKTRHALLRRPLQLASSAVDLFYSCGSILSEGAFCSFFRETTMCLHLLSHTLSELGSSPPPPSHLHLHPLSLCFLSALFWLGTDRACQAVSVCRNDNGPRSGVSALEMSLGYF